MIIRINDKIIIIRKEGADITAGEFNGNQEKTEILLSIEFVLKGINNNIREKKQNARFLPDILFLMLLPLLIIY